MQRFEQLWPSLYLLIDCSGLNCRRCASRALGISETALAAHFEYLCSLSGAQRLAYVPVVASGCVFYLWLTQVY
jgi:hypothetical protein